MKQPITIEAGKKYRVLREDDFVFNPGEIVTAVKEYEWHPSIWVFRNARGQNSCLHVDDVVPVVHVHLPAGAGDPLLPTWPEMVPHERHQLLGELVDAMIYSGHAVDAVKHLVEQFKAAGYVRSVILPADAVIDEPSKSAE